MAEIRSSTFDQVLSQGRPALTTGINEAWCVLPVLLPTTALTDAGAAVSTFRRHLPPRHSIFSRPVLHSRYLDHGVSSPRFIQDDWEPYYMHDPFDGLSAAQLEFVLGGEVDMWGEGVDAANFEPRVFPWATAVGERLWSPKVQSASTEAAADRLRTFRCTLVRRGVRAAPIGPGPPC